LSVLLRIELRIALRIGVSGYQCGCLRHLLRNSLRAKAPVCLAKNLASASQRVTLAVNQGLDFQHHLDVAPAVKPLSSPTLVGFELRKLRLPKPENVGLKAADPCDIANFEVQTIRDRRWQVEGALLGKLRGHSKDEEDTAIGIESSL